METRRVASRRGVVWWEIVVDPNLGSRVELTQTIPAGLSDEVATALAAWHTHLELWSIVDVLQR